MTGLRTPVAILLGMRALGIDYGLRRIGLALSDASGTLASPLTVLLRPKGERDWKKRKLKLDAAAAAILLQDFLDARPRG